MIREDLVNELQEQLEALEKLFDEMSESELKESETYLKNRINANIEKIENLADKSLLPRYEALFRRLILLSKPSSTTQTMDNVITAPVPPREIPNDLKDAYTMGGKIGITSWYFDDRVPENKKVHITAERYKQVFTELQNGTFKYYSIEINGVMKAFEEYFIPNTDIVIWGLASCNCDAISLYHGARKVYVIDYNKPICDHPNVETMSHSEAIEKSLSTDFAISYSSFEHDGLGRYGDPLSPNGDLDAMQEAHRFLKDDGILFFGVPTGPDCLTWNAHRVYGPLRLPLMLKGWQLLDVFETHSAITAQWPFDLILGKFSQFVMVLKKINKDYPDDEYLLSENNTIGERNVLYQRINKLVYDMKHKGKETFVKKQLIHFIDGNSHDWSRSGGLADKLRGVVSAYKIAKELGVEFKLYWTYPVDITEFLVPNKYDWTIDTSDKYYHHHDNIRYYFTDHDKQKYQLKDYLADLSFLFQKFSVVHTFTQRQLCNQEEMRTLFFELFKPTERLQVEIDKHLQNIGSDFISATFRYVNLIGDFDNGTSNRKEISAEEKEDLLAISEKALMQIYTECKPTKILVTSDSITFLNKVQKLPYVYVVSGEIYHYGHSTVNSIDTYLKSFVDFFLLTKSKIVYNVVNGNMYESGFSKLASMLAGSEYKLKKGECPVNDKTSFIPTKRYIDIFREHNHYISDKHIHYLFIYDKLFLNILLRNKPIKLLEIGVQNGGSLEIWKKYLPAGSEIWGIDINENCLKLQFEKGIHFHLGSATDTDFMHQTFSDIVFDVIIDDGSHICSDVIATFEYMFPRLAPGGLYIVEDIHTSYNENFGGKLFKPTSSVEYFKRFADYLHNRSIKSNNDMLSPINIGHEVMQYCIKYVSNIGFYESIVVIEKLFSPKEEFPTGILTGKIGLVVNSFKRNFEEKEDLVDKVKQCYTGV